jgi:hypothetical protein
VQLIRTNADTLTPAQGAFTEMMITHGKTGEPAENLNLQLARSQFQTKRGIHPSAVELMHAQWQPWHSVLREALKEGAAILFF